MPTGEGKTLVAPLFPPDLRALEGKGVHVITVNDYLAKRDYDQIGQIHRFLGSTVGLNVPMMTGPSKQEAYASDITYGVGKMSSVLIISVTIWSIILPKKFNVRITSPSLMKWTVS